MWGKKKQAGRGKDERQAVEGWKGSKGGEDGWSAVGGKREENLSGTKDLQD